MEGNTIDGLKIYMAFGVPFPRMQQGKDSTRLNMSMESEEENRESFTLNKTRNKVTSTRGQKRKQIDTDLIEDEILSKLMGCSKGFKKVSMYTAVDSESSEDDAPLLTLGKHHARKNKTDCVGGTSKVTLKSSKESLSRERSSSLSDSDTNSDTVNNIIRELKEERIKLAEENRILKQELALYKGMNTIVDSFPDVSSKFKRLMKGYKCSRCKSRSSDNEKTVVSTVEKSSVTVSSSSKEKIQPNEETGLPTPPSEKGKRTKEINQNTDIDIVENKEHLMDVIPPVPMHKQESMATTYEPSPLKIVDANAMDSHDEDVICFGSKKVPRQQVKKARHLKITILAGELTALVFTPEEMALSTLKGKKTNAHKGAFQKKALDESRVEGIIRYIADHFGKSVDEINQEVRKAISHKLNNFSTKSEEARKIIKDFKASMEAKAISSENSE